MKRVAVIIVFMVMVASLLLTVESRRALLSGGVMKEELKDKKGVQEGIGSKSSSSSGKIDERNEVSYPEGTTTDNHHNIPRESFHDWGGDGGTNPNENGRG
ncbi:hypothetical protein CDL15_Pgr025553 [Punica granatum]|uniref:Uncharacterized protein n=1 Tax=Punica granatum TaxID=22663 RepID=A0A218WA11_PUNGR|nr:hypothetical protein CDL15_Pgr025553 [Punica granatum]PKI68125.1 hypothetical protein CRG98_011424 [Punica granatum]